MKNILRLYCIHCTVLLLSAISVHAETDKLIITNLRKTKYLHASDDMFLPLTIEASALKGQRVLRVGYRLHTEDFSKSVNNASFQILEKNAELLVVIPEVIISTLGRGDMELEYELRISITTKSAGDSIPKEHVINESFFIDGKAPQPSPSWVLGMHRLKSSISSTRESSLGTNKPPSCILLSTDSKANHSGCDYRSEIGISSDDGCKPILYRFYRILSPDLTLIWPESNGSIQHS